jgi:hypothetical protein
MDAKEWQKWAATQLASIQAVYNEAAENSTGEAKPKFERLRDAYAATISGQVTAESYRTRYAAMDDVSAHCETDPAAAEVLRRMEKRISEVTVRF